VAQHLLLWSMRRWIVRLSRVGQKLAGAAGMVGVDLMDLVIEKRSLLHRQLRYYQDRVFF